MDEITQTPIQAVKEKVDSVARVRARIRALKKAIDENNELLALSAVPAVSHVNTPGRSSGDCSSVEEIQLEKRDELQRKNAQYRLQIVELTQQVQAFEIAAASLEGPYREILKYRFIERMEWYEVEEKVHLKRRRCIQLSRKILPMLAGILHEA